MDSRQRVRTALDHVAPDRVPVNYYATPELEQKLLARLGVGTRGELLVRLGVDLRHLRPPYKGRPLRRWSDGRYEDMWGTVYRPVRYATGVYDEAEVLPYSGVGTVEEVWALPGPSPDDFDYAAVPALCDALKGYAVVAGDAGVPDMINGAGRMRGVQQVVMDIGLEDPVGLAVMEKRARFCLAHMERLLDAAKGRADILALGDDYGTQRGLLMSPASWRKLFKPWLRRFIDLGHSYGCKVMLHCCGSSRAILDEFVEVGLDVLETVQPEAEGMDPADLKALYGRKLSLCGTVSVQHTLPHGAREDVVAEVRHRIEVVGKDGGLILASAHAMQPDIPVENALAIYETAGSMTR
jgi:uroporphyrinogen decarboxylase